MQDTQERENDKDCLQSSTQKENRKEKRERAKHGCLLVFGFSLHIAFSSSTTLRTVFDGEENKRKKRVIVRIVWLY